MSGKEVEREGKKKDGRRRRGTRKGEEKRRKIDKGRICEGACSFCMFSQPNLDVFCIYAT